MIHRRKPLRPAPKWHGPKPKLAMVQVPYYRVRYEDLEDYVALVYRFQHWNFLAVTGCTHGMCPEYIVTGSIPATWEVEKQADSIRRGYRTRNPQLLLDILCHDGFIPAGKYVIDTHWRPSPDAAYRQLLEQTRNPLDPQCLAFKEKHRADQTFCERVKVLDAACSQYLNQETNVEILP